MKGTMGRLYSTLRLLAVIVAAPAIALYIALCTLLHPIAAIRNRFHVALRLWMNVTDWVTGVPVGYSYWERYLAPAMLDDIAVHHHEDSSS